MKTGIIYQLIDPTNNKIRYVGQTIRSLKERLNKHICDSKKSQRHVCNWINSLINIGLIPIIEEVEIASIDLLDEKEIELIAKYKSLGFDLTNTDLGGQVNRVFSDETKQKMSDTKKAAWSNLDYKEKQGAAIRAGKDATKSINAEKYSLHAIQLLHTPEMQAKRTAGIRIALNKDSYKQLKSKQMLDNWSSLNEDQKSKRIAGLRSNEELRKHSARLAVQTPEYRNNQSDIIRKRLEKPFQVFNMSNELVGTWKNIIVAARELNIREQGLSTVLHKRGKTVSGYKASFI